MLEPGSRRLGQVYEVPEETDVTEEPTDISMPWDDLEFLGRWSWKDGQVAEVQ